MLLALTLENGPDAVEGAIEFVGILEPEVQFPVLQRIHHVRHFPDRPLAGSYYRYHRCYSGDDDAK